MDKSEQLEKLPIRKLIVMFSTPAIFSFVVSTMNMAVDRIFIGKAVGTAALAAVTVALGIQTLIQGVSQIIAAGASSSISLEMGKNNKEKVDLLIGNAFSISIAMSILISIFGCVFLKPILILFGAGPESMDYAVEYTFVMIGSTVLFFISQVMNNIIRSMGYAKKAMYNFLASIITNTILDVVFLFGLNLGVKGAALATSAGYIVSGMLSLSFLMRGKAFGRLKFDALKVNKNVVKRIIIIGLPAFIMQAALSLVTLVFNQVSNKYGGTIGQASYGIINVITMSVYMPVMGLCMGIQSIVGVNYGAGLFQRVKETMYKSVKYTSIFCGAVFLIMEVFSNNIAGLFADSGSIELIKCAASGIRITGISIPFVGAEMVVANYFQYVGKPKKSIFFSILRHFILLIPSALILPIFLGISGMFSALIISDVLSFIIMILLFVSEFRNISQVNESISGYKAKKICN